MKGFVTRRNVAIALQCVLLVGSLVAAVLTNRASDWEPLGLLLLLAVMAIVGDLLAIEAKGIHLSAAGLAIVLAMCFLGPTPAVGMGLLATLVVAAAKPPPRALLLNNLATFATYPLVGGLLARLANGGTGHSALA